MKTTALLVSLAFAALVPGCAQSPPTQLSSVTCTSTTCHIKVSVTNGVVSVDIDELHLKGVHDVSIVWHLPNDYVFLTALGDGAFLKRDDDGQFDDLYPTDNDSGAPGPNRKAGKNYHWKGKNTVVKTYQYKLLFHNQAGTAFFLDPTIMNDG